MIQRLLFFLLIISISTYFLVITPGCANMLPPTGGPRDSLPPELIEVNPDDSTRNFTGKRITFVFDEFVQLDNPVANVLVSPTPKNPPEIKSKLRTVTVELKDTLEENTTYTIDFGNSIKDINEQNTLRDFSYLFSTGSTLDSLEFIGKVILAETGEIDSTLTVLLHRNLDDSAVAKDRPRYRARLDRQGNFRFTNLPHGVFAVYAISDKGGGLNYLSREQLFGFLDQPVNIDSNTPPVTIYAYQAPKDTTSSVPAIRSTAIRGAPSVADRRLRIETNLVDGQLDLLKNLEIRFPATPLRYFDSSKVQFLNESFNPVTGYRFTLDTSRQKVTLQYNWAPYWQYHLIIDKDFAEDTLGRKLLRSDTLSFRTRKETEYGEVRLRFPNLDLQRNPVLLFVQNNTIVQSHVFTSKQFNARLFNPGEYQLRILYDDNKNGKFDPGEFFGVRRQPERVVTIERRITIKPNWVNEVDINL